MEAASELAKLLEREGDLVLARARFQRTLTVRVTVRSFPTGSEAVITTRILRVPLGARRRSETDTLSELVAPLLGALSLAPARARASYETMFIATSSRAENVTRTR